MKKEISEEKDEEESGLEEDIEEAEEEIDDIQLKEFVNPIIMPPHASPVLEKIKIPAQESSLEEDVSSAPMPEKEDENFKEYKTDSKYIETKYEREGKKYHTDTETKKNFE